MCHCVALMISLIYRLCVLLVWVLFIAFHTVRLSFLSVAPPTVPSVFAIIRSALLAITSFAVLSVVGGGFTLLTLLLCVLVVSSSEKQSFSLSTSFSLGFQECLEVRP